MKPIRRLLSGLCVAVLSLTANLVAASPAQAAITHHGGYVFAMQPTNPDYTAVLGWYAANSAGGQIRITRTATGTYSVRFGGLAGLIPNGGVAHVSAVNQNGRFCTVGSWFPSAGDILVAVNCFDHNGQRADTQFAANYIAATGTQSAGRYAYAWADQRTNPSYVPHPHYRYDAHGGGPVVYWDSTGNYRVYFPAATVETTLTFHQVTAYGSSPVKCAVMARVAPGTVSVQCRNASGSLVNTEFSITYSNNPLLRNQPYREAYIYNIVIPSWPILTGVGWSSGSPGTGVITVQRWSPGRYYVRMDNTQIPRGHTVVYATATPDRYCGPISWLGGSNSEVEVACFNSNGTPADSHFFIAVTN